MSASIALRSLGSVLGDELHCLLTTFSPSYNLLAWARFIPQSYTAFAAAGGMAPTAVPGPEAASAVLDAFVSYSLEFAFFPDFAGNSSAPNTFSDNLLANLGDLQGVRPYIRVGGNTQDYALYDETLPYAVNGTYDAARSKDYPTTVYIGPSFFESYGTLADTKFTHGFNLGLGANRSDGWETLRATVPLACRAIGRDNLDVWEYGNEPDLYSTSAQGPVRPPSWDEAAYVAQWLNGTREIAALLADACPDFPQPPAFKAPSNAGTTNRLRAPAQWAAGLNADANVALFSTHNYISGAESPGVTLQGTLMNHSRTVDSVRAHVREYVNMTARFADVPPHVLGEHNSLYNQGKPGLSNSFGAALWGVDFNLYAASQGIKRSHMHMGTDYRYQSWQPVDTNTTAKGTKAPYYGNVAVAAFLAPPPKPSSSSSSSSLPDPVSVAHIPLDDNNDGRSAAYAAYHGATLARLLVVDLHAHNSTLDGAGTVPDPDPKSRLVFPHSFAVPWRTGLATLRRLRANGTDAITGITWDGWSYNHELDGGRPVRLDNVTVGEYALVDAGRVTFTVSAGEAVIVSPDSGCRRGS